MAAQQKQHQEQQKQHQEQQKQHQEQMQTLQDQNQKLLAALTTSTQSGGNTVVTIPSFTPFDSSNELWSDYGHGSSRSPEFTPYKRQNKHKCS